MSLAKKKWEMHIKMMYNITTFITNVFQYQMANYNNAKLQLLLYQVFVQVLITTNMWHCFRYG